ncbi:MAG: EcsC family protein [Thiohalocapsa sp.]
MNAKQSCEMPGIEHEVVHAIHGRIRMRVPRLRQDGDFATRLRALVSALEAVIEVRVDRAAASVVVHYGETGLSADELQARLVTAIEQAANLQPSRPLAMRAFGYEFRDLSAYDYLQLREIIKWREQPVSLFTHISRKALTPVQNLAGALIPDVVLQKVISLFATATENWTDEWEDLEQHAKVEHPADLKEKPLEYCDRLAESVQDRAVALASVEGAAGAVMGMAGGLTDVDLLLRVPLQAIHRTGLCYGYIAQNEREQQFAWSIFEATTALTTQERENALSRIELLQHLLYHQASEDSTQEWIRARLKDLTTEAILKRVLPNMFRLESTNALPVIGMLTGIAGARSMISAVTTAARREFQLRRMLEDQQRKRRSDV